MNKEIANVPKLGFGMMRLPIKEDNIDIDMVCEMVDMAMQNGINYFDTAYVYHSGKSEGIIKEAVVNRYNREEYYIADKLPGWEIKEQSDVKKLFDEQLKRTGLDYFDFYLLHSINKNHLAMYDEYNC